MHPRQLAKHIILENQSDLARRCRRYLEWMTIKNYSPTTTENRRYPPELLRATGIKRKEFCNLTTENLNLENQTLLVNHKNPERTRTIPISHDATKWLKLYLSHSRPIIEQTPNKTLFLSNGGNPMSHITASLRLTEYFAKAKIPKPGTFSIFRHTLAIRLLNHNADIRHVQKLLGHKELSSTQIYTKVSIRHLKQVHQETHPSEDCN